MLLWRRSTVQKLPIHQLELPIMLKTKVSESRETSVRVLRFKKHENGTST